MKKNVVQKLTSEFITPGIAGKVIWIGTILFGSKPMTAAGGGGRDVDDAVVFPALLLLELSALFDADAARLALDFELDYNKK